MKTITEQKPLDEVIKYLERYTTVYLIGCGTCATMCRTGGKAEVLEMKEKLEAAGKKVSGWMVSPTACDELTGEALKENAEAVAAADCILVLACAFGVQAVAIGSDKPVYPALNTMFIGRETGEPGYFKEVCLQCGECVLGQYAVICPLTQCAKGLLNGPCGGSRGGRCEQQSEQDCAWILIYRRLKQFGELDRLKEIAAAKDHSKMKKPRTFRVTDGGVK